MGVDRGTSHRAVDALDRHAIDLGQAEPDRDVPRHDRAVGPGVSGHFPSDEAAIKLLWLALRNILADKVRSAKEWKAAMNQFAVRYGDRFTAIHA